VDLTWLIDTASIIGAGEAYLLITWITGYDLDAYQAWLERTYARLAGVEQ
jgi:hypothetical protein